MKTKAALKATKLAASATRYANDRRMLRADADLVAARITRLIAMIAKLSDVAAGPAKQEALTAAWAAYAKATRSM
jgi:hypothetical protein